MQSTATRSAVTAKMTVAIVGGIIIGWISFNTLKAAITGAVIGFLIAFLWQ